MAHLSEAFALLAGMALLCIAALHAPAGTGFVAPPALRSSTGLRTFGAAGGAGVIEDAAEGKSEFGMTGAACALVAAAGLAALAARGHRASAATTAVRASGRPLLVVEWQVDPKTPVPGSEKAAAAMVGVDVETGSVLWDPLGFSKLYDRNFDFNNVMTYPHVQWLREAEIKHGRACMLAFVGMVAQGFFHIPGMPVEPDWSQTLAACYTDKTASLGLVQVSVFAMIVEGRFNPTDAWIGQMDREPGDYGFDPLKLSKKPGFDFAKAQLQEIKNGRLAMIGVMSIFANHGIPGSVPFLSGVTYAVRPDERPAKTAARYTTQKILPALSWIKAGLKLTDLAPRELRAKNLGGTDVLVGKTESGSLFCVGNLCPHIGTPMSEGADVIGDVIVCPLHGSSFKVTTGELIDWCPSPPIIGFLTGFVIEKKNLAVFDVRTSFFGGDIEVLVDTNAKRAYEASYWKGVLDAQGKNDGTFY